MRDRDHPFGATRDAGHDYTPQPVVERILRTRDPDRVGHSDDPPGMRPQRPGHRDGVHNIGTSAIGQPAKRGDLAESPKAGSTDHPTADDVDLRRPRFLDEG